MGEDGTYRVLVVDDDRRILRAVSRVVRGRGWIVGTAATIAAARTQLESGQWDVVLLDLFLQDGERGTDLLPDIASLSPTPAVAIVSGYLDAEKMFRLHQSCEMTVSKPVPGKLLLEIIEFLATKGKERADGYVVAFCCEKKLSGRETDVFRQGVKGRRDKQTAEVLGIRRGSVSTYWGRILNKTGYQSRQQMMWALFEYGMRREAGC